MKLWTNSSSENFQLSEELYMSEILGGVFFFLHLVQRSRTALGTGKTTQFLLLSKAANPFIRVPPIVTKAKNYLLWVLNQESLFFLLFGFFLKPFGFNGEHAYKIKGGKFGACISHHRWLHSGVMSLSQLYTAFVSRGSVSALIYRWGINEGKADLIWWQTVDKSSGYLKTA